MTRQDFDILLSFAERMPEVRRVGVCSPIKEGERKIFPGAKSLPRWRWDLNKPTRRRFDLLVASNVFMYSPHPDRWLRNVLAATKYFLMVDIVKRRRRPDREYGDDGDCCRYAIGEDKPRVDRFYDLNVLSDRLIAHRTYFGGRNEHDESPLHVIALFRGNLASPLLRIDDYPTGVRPILEDMTPLHTILEKVEASGLRYHLGIVPRLLTPDMMSFLSGLDNMVPAMHGYDHCYPQYAPVLMDAGDPYNANTVGVFNEFEGMAYEDVLGKLQEGRRLIEEGVGKQLRAYIPPCNIGDEKTGRALEAAGFEYYLSEKRIRGCPLPWIKSDFYGRSNAFRDANQDVVSIHLTWEWDLIREKKLDSLEHMLQGLAARTRREQQRGQQLAAAVAEAV